MKLRLTSLIFIICLFAGLSAKANGIELTFDPDSLIQTGQENNFIYPATQTITINPKLSLPVKTVYIEMTANPSIITDLEISVEKIDRLRIGTVPEDKLKFSNLITALENRQQSSPLHDISNFENVLYNKQIIKRGELSMIAVSILPVTIDKDNNLIFNARVTINTETPQNGTYTGKTLYSKLDDYVSNRANIFSNKVSTSDSAETVPKYVIITSGDLAPAFKEMVDFKNAIGISTIIKLTDSIYANYSGLDEIEQIRNYLIDFYNNGGEYVLLGGNDVVVPVRYLYYYNTSTPPSNTYNLMPSDLYYADLDGDWDVDGDGIWGEPTHDAPDIVPELMVGRLPVMTSEAVENYVSKLILYQTNPGFGDYDYLEKTLIFSSDQMRDYPSMGQHGYIANELPDNIATDTAQTIEMPDGVDLTPTNPNGASGITKMSDGFGLV